MSNDNLLFFSNTNKTVENLQKVLKVDENQENNLNIILSMCIKENNYKLFYKYLYSEINFRGGISNFSEKVEISQIKIRNFLHSNIQPDLNILSKILNELGFSLVINRNR